MEIPGLAIPKPEGATVKDRRLVAGRLARVVQEKEREIDRLQEETAKLQQQLEVTTDNKVRTFEVFFGVLLCVASCLKTKKKPLRPSSNCFVFYCRLNLKMPVLQFEAML